MLRKRDSLCRKYSLTLAILLETLVTKRLAFRRLLDVLSFFIANLFCLRFLFFSSFASCFLGKSYAATQKCLGISVA